ncbi:hypothetical protein AAY473_022741 [Plecturocebus cupreus]
MQQDTKGLDKSRWAQEANATYKWRQSLAPSPGWSAVARSQFTATSASWVQAIPCLSFPNRVSLFHPGHVIMYHCRLNLPGSSNPPTSLSQAAVTTRVHHTWIFFFFKRGSPYVAQTGIKLSRLKWNLAVTQAGCSVMNLAQLIFVFLVEIVFHHNGQAGLELLALHGLALSPRLECSGMILAHCNLCFQDTETEFHHVAQAGLELLDSHNPPASASQSATGMSHCTLPSLNLHSLSLPPKLECNRTSIAHCKLKLLGSSHPPDLAFQGEQGESHFVAQANLKLPVSSNPPALAFQSAGIISIVSVTQAETILAHHNLHFLSSSNSHASASQVAGITGMQYHARLIFVFLVEMGFHNVGQAGLELLALSSGPPTLAPQSTGITETGFCHVGQAGLELLASSDLLILAPKVLGLQKLLLPRLECSGAILAHCNLCLLGSIEMGFFHHVGQACLELLSSGDLPASASQSTEIIGMESPTVVTLECSGMISAHCNLCLPGSKMGSHYVSQAAVKLLGLKNAPALASQHAGIIGVSHHTQLKTSCFEDKPRLNDLAYFLMIQSLVLLPGIRLEYSGTISAHCNLCLLGSSNSPASVSQRQGFSVLVRWVLNPRPQVIHPPLPPKVLRLQSYAGLY